MSDKPLPFLRINGEPSPLEQRAIAFHQANPDVWALFIKYAKLAAAAVPHWACRAIFHRIRWYAQIDTKSQDDFKINNNHSPYYARLFEQEFPEHKGFFTTCITKGEEFRGEGEHEDHKT
jgi:hypothetical protein